LDDLLFTDLNISSFLHQNGEEDLSFLDPNIEFILIVRDLNQGNPSIKFAMDRLGTGLDLHFLLHAIWYRLQPFATRAVWHGEKSHF